MWWLPGAVALALALGSLTTWLYATNRSVTPGIHTRAHQRRQRARHQPQHRARGARRT